MQHRQPARESGGEAPDCLRGERDLRHQDQALAALSQHIIEQAQVDLGLAAAGDAMEQKDIGLVSGEGYRDPLRRRLLCRLQADGSHRGHGTGLPQDATLPPSLHGSADDRTHPRRHDGADHLVQRHQVMRGHEAGQLDKHRRQHRLGIEQRLDRLELEDVGRLLQGVDESGHGPFSEGHPHPMADLDHSRQRIGDRVVEEAGLTPDARLDRDLRDSAQAGVRRRDCAWYRWHPRSVRPPPIWAAAEYLPPRRTPKRS